MTVHAIRALVAADSGMTDAEVQAVVDDWVSKRTKWGDTWDATVERRNTAMDGSGTDYLTVAVRFTWDAGKDNTLQKFADKLKHKVAWFAAVYHACDHDESQPAGCSWEERWEWDDGGGIPAAVEPLVPDAPAVVDA